MIISWGMKWAIPHLVRFELCIAVYFVVVDVCVGGMSRNKQTHGIEESVPF
jgi:hypothetical protein